MTTGYKKPPIHSRFPPGRSGNPSGKRKKPVSLESLLMEPVQITRNGKRQSVSVYEAQMLVQVKRALTDQNLGAVRTLFKLLKKYDALEFTKQDVARAPIERSDNLPSELRHQLVRGARGRIPSIEEMDEIRRRYFANASELDSIRNDEGCFTSNEELRNFMITST